MAAGSCLPKYTEQTISTFCRLVESRSPGYNAAHRHHAKEDGGESPFDPLPTSQFLTGSNSGSLIPLRRGSGPAGANRTRRDMDTRAGIRKLALGALAVASLFAGVNAAFAQVVTGTLGSADATTTINGKQTPPPPPKFGGVIKETAKDSTPWWPPRIVPPKGAPNVLLIMTDDQGYGVPGTFGGVIPTPNLDRIAKSGLRYIQFHSTALCSPTRAVLITGRNHHSVGFGVIGELSTGYPGYDSVIGQDNATIAEILKENGYATSWFGKDHNTPGFTYSTTAGPFDQWPIGMGFQYFYGFLG